MLAALSERPSNYNNCNAVMQSSPRQIIIKLRRFLLWNWLASRLLVSVIMRSLLALLLLALWSLLLALWHLLASLLRLAVKHLHLVDDNLCGVFLMALLILPLAGLELAFQV